MQAARLDLEANRTMPFFEWIIVLGCSMVSVIVLPGLIATRICPAEPDDPGNQGMRKTLLWVGGITDTTAAVFTGSLLGIPWWPALVVGLLFFIGKVGLAEVWSRRLHPGPVQQLTEEEVRQREERMRARAEELQHATGSSLQKRGLSAWSGFALINLVFLILLLLPFRLWLGS